jgi:hypothetical protein
MNHTSDFDIDLKFGQEAEELVRHIGTTATIEVKRDKWTCKTGNVAVEYKSRGKPSGIAVTKAEWWAFVLSDSPFNDEVILLIKTSKLKGIARGYWNRGNTKKMGDGNTSEAVLIPLSKLFSRREND